MITLYAKTGCPFCEKAISALDAHGLSYTKKNIADEAVAAELISLGGKRQVPFMVDGDMMTYESGVIVEYVEETYGKGAETAKPHITVSANHCDADNEGGKEGCSF